jgi:hypothetical protein
MERQRTTQRPAPSAGGGPEPGSEGGEVILARDLLAAADRILDSIKPVNAELYLQQNQQRGGQ